MADLKAAAKALADELRKTAAALEKGNFEALRSGVIEAIQTAAVLVEQHADTVTQLNGFAQIVRDPVRRLGQKGML